MTQNENCFIRVYGLLAMYIRNSFPNNAPGCGTKHACLLVQPRCGWTLRLRHDIGIISTVDQQTQERQYGLPTTIQHKM